METSAGGRERTWRLWTVVVMAIGVLAGYAIGVLVSRIAAPVSSPISSLLDVAITLVALAAASFLYGAVSDARGAARARRLRVELERIYVGDPELFDSIRARAAAVST